MSITCNEISLLQTLDLVRRQVLLNQLIQAFKQIQGLPAQVINDGLQR
ncbi:hypothetical protein BN133_3283 [Cronobacter dublinensis 582]|nr:hypothetical protein BN133_3283 [Cronobacter dublinensis 582]